MPFQQMLLTRYNVQFSAAAKAGIDSLSADWLDHRDRLFRRYCLASVQNQKRRDFDWFVFFHPDTPRKYWDFLAPVGIPILAPTTPDAVETIRRHHLRADTIVTSRIDNDDAIAPNFMHEVRAIAEQALRTGFNGGGEFAVSFNNGIVVEAASGRWYRRQQVCGPFVTLVQRPGDGPWRSPLTLTHNDVPQLFKTIFIDNQAPMWAAVVHERNILNHKLWNAATVPDGTVRGFPRKFPKYRQLESAVGRLKQWLRRRV